MENFSFRIQDVFRIFIPGGILFTIISLIILSNKEFYDTLILYKDFSNIALIIFVICSSFIGYCIDMMASVFQKFFYRFFKKPSYYLLNKSSYCKFYDSEYSIDKTFFKKIITDYSLTIICNEKVENNATTSADENNVIYTKEETTSFFKCCNRLKEKNSDKPTYDKLNSYFYAKIFSRNITATIFFLIILSFAKFKLFVLIFLLILFFFSFYRWMKLSFNYTRQVFIVCE